MLGSDPLGFVPLGGLGEQASALTASNLRTGSPVIGTPSIGQVHALSASNLRTGSPVIGTPTIGQKHALVATSLRTGSPVIGAPAIGQKHVLTATSLRTGSPVIGTPTLGLVSVDLVATSLRTGSPVIGTPDITNFTPDVEYLDSPPGIVVVKITGPGTTKWFQWDHERNPFNIGFGCVVNGSCTYTVQHTFDDPQEVVNPVAFNNFAINGVSDSQNGNYAYPIQAIRITVTAGGGSVTVSIIQSGLSS